MHRRNRNNLRAIRERRGFTQWDIADLIGRSQSLVWSIESGRREPSAMTRKRLAKVLGVSARTLFPR